MNKIKSKDDSSKIWVMLAPDGQVINENGTADIVKLRHPRTREAAMYLFSPNGHSVCEILAHESEKGSWFINDSVRENGRLHITTPVDPVFLVLPYLISVKNEGRTQPLQDLLVDPDFPETHRLIKCTGLKHMHCVADRKGSEDLNAWSYNEKKTLEWLKLKTDKVADSLKNNHAALDGSAVSENFVVSAKLKNTSDSFGYLRYACGLVSEYLINELSSKLREHLNLPKEGGKRKLPLEEMNEIKRNKLNTTDSSPPSNNSTKKPKGPSAREKSQMRAAAGTKSITSFFKKK